MPQFFPSLKTIRLLLLVIFINGMLPNNTQANCNVISDALNKIITISFNNITLKDALDKISNEAGVPIVYSNSIQMLNNPISLNAKKRRLGDVLYQVLNPISLSYEVIGDKIIITRDNKHVLKAKRDFATPPKNIKGRIIDKNGQALPGASVRIKGDSRVVVADRYGEFELNDIPVNAVIQISYIGYKSSELQLTNDLNTYLITLESSDSNLNEVNVVSTGYESLPKERATGSFTQIDNKLINRSVSTNVLDRLDGVTSGLIFNKNVNLGNTSSSTVTIRGVSTIYANQNPLIVVDNYPYSGDLSSINPNDVATITILKDAAAASIWGAFSGNGVVVITTKKGKYKQGPKIEINGSLTIGSKPDLNYAPQLTSSHYIEVEQYLFKQGYYDNSLTSLTYPGVSPIVDMLDKRRNNLIFSKDSADIITQYGGQDSRKDISKFLYRKSINQQYNINISGGGDYNVYYFSVGYDKNLDNINRNDFDRLTINGTNTFSFFNKKLELTTGIYYTKNKTDNNGINSIASPYPYLKLKNPDGSAAAVPFEYRQEYIDTIGHGNLLDWHYRPLDELALNHNTTTLNEYRINANLKYAIATGINASVQYQYDQGISNNQILYSDQSFYTRDYINQFTQYDPATNTYTRPVPFGGIMDRANLTSTSQNVRGQINYYHQWNLANSLSILGGAEVRNITTENNTNRVYGYDDLGSTAAINYQTQFLLMPTYNTTTINSNLSQVGTTNRFVSYFANAAYTFKDRYILSASGRKDESNLFGVKTNQKGVPLWSVGASWDISKEPAYHINWLPYLRLRITNGFQGNVDNTLSALVTATTNSLLINSYAQPVSALSNPPNPDLRWEKVNIKNIGIDFILKKVLGGTVEFYTKNGSDLIGTSAVDPTTGVTVFKGNSADMNGMGMDITLNSTNLSGPFKWRTTFLLSLTKDKVTKYLLKPTTIANAFYGISPIVGNPLYSLYTFKWAGLDASGDPLVYLNGKPSKDYSAIYNSTDLSNLKYEGSLTPTTFGSLRNDFDFHRFSLSINITYKLGYYFRRPSINYGTLFTGTATMPDADYENRWQKTGDENRTNVPAMIFPDNNLRDIIYQNSSALTDKGDHIRLQDVSVSYDLIHGQHPKLPFSQIKLYAYINNIGILWRANKDGIDPDYIPNSSTVYPNPRTYALGFKASL